MTTKTQRKTTDERMYHAAEDAFTSEGGGSIPVASQRERDMKEFSIRRDGLRYAYRGYHYDLLSDALGYARLLRSREQVQQGVSLGQRQAIAPRVPEPTEVQRKLMVTLDIGYDEGSYRVGDFRYARLVDAVHYAGKIARQHADHDR